MKTHLKPAWSFALLMPLGICAAAGQETPKPKPVTSQKEDALSNRAASGADKVADQSADAAVQPFMEEDALAVARLDTSTINIADYQQWVSKVLDASKLDAAQIKEAKAQTADAMKQAGDWLHRFNQAGGSRVYVVFSLMDVPARPPFLVVPLEKGADGKALIDLIRSTSEAATEPSPQQFTAEKIGDSVVAGLPATLSRLKTAPPSKRRPEVAAALASAQGVLRFAVVPGDGPRQMLEAASPKLPEELGGVPAKVVTQGMTWLSASITAPPQVSFQIVIQAKDAAAARELNQLTLKAEDALARHALDWKLPFDTGTLVALLKPRIEGDRLIASIDADHTRQLAENVVIPVLVKSRTQAAAISSANHMRQILLACVMYSEKNQNHWPDSLQQVEPFIGKEAMAPILMNPAHPEKNPGYIYRKPPESMKYTNSTAVLYEAHDVWPGVVVVGFADGHVEMINDPTAFKHALGDDVK